MKQIEFQFSQKVLTCFLLGEIDHHAAENMREQIDARLLNLTPEKVVLDFSEVSFMDSSGIGLILGRNTMMKVLGGRLIIQNPPEHITRVLELAKIDKMTTLQEETVK